MSAPGSPILSPDEASIKDYLTVLSDNSDASSFSGDEGDSGNNQASSLTEAVHVADFPSGKESAFGDEIDFDFIMSDNRFRSLYRRFLWSECNTESLDFLEDMDNLRRLVNEGTISPHGAAETRVFLFHKYFTATSSYMLNLPASYINKIRKHYTTEARTSGSDKEAAVLFDDAYSYVRAALRQDSFLRFIVSEEYKSFTRQLRFKTLSTTKAQYLVSMMQKPYTGVRLQEVTTPTTGGSRSKKKAITHVFSGTDAVAWLIQEFGLTDRTEGVDFMNKLVKTNVVTPVAPEVTNFVEQSMYKFARKKRVVIIGGGFGGSYAAKKLQKDYEVVLIDRKPFFECTLSFPDALIDPSAWDTIRVRHSNYLKSCTILCADVARVTPTHVHIKPSSFSVEAQARWLPLTNNNNNSGRQAEERIRFDYLIVASGSTYKIPFPISSAAAAAAVAAAGTGKDTVVVNPYVSESIIASYSRLEKAKTIAVIGGGPVCIEIVGQLATKYTNKKLYVLVEHNQLMERCCKTAHKSVSAFIKKSFPNVHIQYDSRVTKIEADVIWVQDKPPLTGIDLVYVCTGTCANSEFMQPHFPYACRRNGRIHINAHFQVASGEKTFYPNIFAIGDICDLPEEKLAETAEKHARTVVSIIVELDHSAEKLTSYELSAKVPLIVRIGPKHGFLVKGDSVLLETGALLAKVKKIAVLKKIRNICASPPSALYTDETKNASH